MTDAPIDLRDCALFRGNPFARRDDKALCQPRIVAALTWLLSHIQLRHLGVAVVCIAVVEAVFLANVLEAVLKGWVPFHVTAVTTLTTLIVSTPLVAISISTIFRLDGARKAYCEQAVLLDQRNSELDRAKSDLQARAIALEEERRKADAANRAKSEFLANMSHELRTPLNAILGFSEMLGQQDTLFGGISSQRTEEYAGAIHGSGKHLLLLVNDLLDLARIEAGRQELFPESVEVEALIGEVILSLLPQTTLRGQTVETCLAHSPESLIADPRAMHQIVLNLLSNALKYSDEDTTVRVEVSGDARGTTISVIDRGIGMTREEAEIVLTPFARLSAVHIASGDSCGLGLSIVKALIDLHGGTLMLESEKGVGTTARVFIPADIRAS